mgnify:CR=1 FL=1
MVANPPPATVSGTALLIGHPKSLKRRQDPTAPQPCFCFGGDRDPCCAVSSPPSQRGAWFLARDVIGWLRRFSAKGCLGVCLFRPPCSYFSLLPCRKTDGGFEGVWPCLFALFWHLWTGLWAKLEIR